MGGNIIPMAHCLIVDDSRVIRAVARRIFEDLHFIACEAKDGLSALRACRKKMPDLILLDWSMPGMTGEDCCSDSIGDRGASILTASPFPKVVKIVAIIAGPHNSKQAQCYAQHRAAYCCRQAKGQP